MTERRYLCHVDESHHKFDIGFGMGGWQATFRAFGGTPMKQDYRIPGKFQIFIPYDNDAFGNAAACFAEGKKLYWQGLSLQPDE